MTEQRQEISDLGSRLGSLINNTNEGFILVSNRKQGNPGSGGATPSISPPSRSNNILPYPIYPAARHAKTVQHPKQTVAHQSPFVPGRTFAAAVRTTSRTKRSVDPDRGPGQRLRHRSEQRRRTEEVGVVKEGGQGPGPRPESDGWWSASAGSHVRGLGGCHHRSINNPSPPALQTACLSTCLDDVTKTDP